MENAGYLAKCSISIAPRLRENPAADGDKSYTVLKPDQFWLKATLYLFVLLYRTVIIISISRPCNAQNDLAVDAP